MNKVRRFPRFVSCRRRRRCRSIGERQRNAVRAVLRKKQTNKTEQKLEGGTRNTAEQRPVRFRPSSVANCVGRAVFSFVISFLFFSPFFYLKKKLVISPSCRCCCGRSFGGAIEPFAMAESTKKKNSQRSTSLLSGNFCLLLKKTNKKQTNDNHRVFRGHTIASPDWSAGPLHPRRSQRQRRNWNVNGNCNRPLCSSRNEPNLIP